MILILRVLTGLSETHPQRHHTKFPFLQKTHGKRFSLCRLKIIFLTSYGTVSLIDIFGEQMNDSSVKEKQTKSAIAKSAISLQVTEPSVSNTDSEELMRIAIEIVEEK